MTDKERLAQAEEAYHSLLTGTAVARVVDQNGESVNFVRADLPKLSQYIDQLKRKLDTSTDSPRGPLNVWF